ncbi:VOC family protein [Bosea sp. F3-2]|uniref:VOC family protein n=1 Tax=Bosea sp. F3-2 TaxID=2599640 RepID=UPI0016555C3A|nr:VOC family protein [Bosea sp. F3-2]
MSLDAVAASHHQLRGLPVLPASVQQIAYVVPDLRRAIAHWVNTAGVGPFSVREHIGYKQFQFEGKDYSVDYSIAQAWHGDLQIELLCQHDDLPSVLTRFPAPSNSIHHIGCRVEDFDTGRAQLLGRGFREVQRVLAPNGTIAGFFHSAETVGLIELVYLADGGAGWREQQRLAREWDGSSLYA